MKNKGSIAAIAGAVAILAALFAWLYWGSTVPEPTKEQKDTAVKATITDTVMSRQREDGSKLWDLKIKTASQMSDKLITGKDISGTIYLKDGDELYIKAPAGKFEQEQNFVTLSGGVTATLKSGGKLTAKTVTWDRIKDILTAQGKSRVIRENLLATGDKIVTTSKLKHFKVIGKAHVERSKENYEN